MKTNKEIFAETYFNSFIESYPALPVERATDLIKKAILTATENIRHVLIDSPAFKLTAEKLGIKNTYKAYEEFFNQTKGV